MTTYRWLVFTGKGLQLHSAHNSVEDAFATVHREIAEINEWRVNTQNDDCTTDGPPRLYYWDCPMRAMTTAEIEDADHPDNVKRQWKKMPPNTADYAAADRQGVKFRNGRVDHVSICREDRHRQYLDRAGSCNDVRERTAEVDRAVASV